MSQEDIERSLRNCLKENVSNVLANISSLNGQNNSNGKIKRQNGKKESNVSNSNSSADVTTNNFSNISAQEYLENDLKDKLIEIEEQIFNGALGHLKVQDRTKWKEALQNFRYDPQCENLSWGDQTRPSLEITNSEVINSQINYISSSLYTSSSASPLTLEVNLAIVNNLAKVLLQIEQSVEKNFFECH